jgi:hypothetical protein
LPEAAKAPVSGCVTPILMASWRNARPSQGGGDEKCGKAAIHGFSLIDRTEILYSNALHE